MVASADRDGAWAAARLTTGLLLAPSGAGILSEHTVERVIPWIALPGNIFLALIKRRAEMATTPAALAGCA